MAIAVATMVDLVIATKLVTIAIELGEAKKCSHAIHQNINTCLYNHFSLLPPRMYHPPRPFYKSFLRWPPPEHPPLSSPLLKTEVKQNSLTMSEQPQQQQQRPLTQKFYQSAPDSRQTVKFLTATTIGTVFLLLSGLTLTGTVIGLIVATPVLVIFSPILVPAAVTIFLVGSGFLFSGGCGVAALSAVSWIYSYVAGKHPPGANQLDKAGEKIASTAKDVKELRAA
ncbi:hypothetical protein Ancab_022935 [Ancistrocladus abbreviatus]